MNRRLLGFFTFAFIVFTTALPVFAGDSVEDMIKLRRARAFDFAQRMADEAQSARRRNETAVEASRLRQRDEGERERVRASYVQKRVEKDWAEIERQDARDEQRLEQERNRRDLLRQKFVADRERILERLRGAATIDEDLEFGLVGRDENRMRPIRNTIQKKDMKKQQAPSDTQ